MVTQNRQAVGVQDPLKLAHHLEKLGGTANLMTLIHVKQQEICQVSLQCENLTDDTVRYSQTRLKHLRLVWPFLGVCLQSVVSLDCPEVVQIQQSSMHIRYASLQPPHMLNKMYASRPNQLGPQGRTAKKPFGTSRHQMEGL